jgi:hypothetical protein
LGRTEHNQGNFAAGQVLLVAHVVVRGQQQVVPSFFGFGQQIAVGQPVPAAIFGFRNTVLGQIGGQGCRRTVIKQDEHRVLLLSRG